MQDFLKIASDLGGIAGLMLAGLIYFVGRRLLRLEEAFDRHTRMELMRLIASPHVSTDVKLQLGSQLTEVVEAQKVRAGR